MPQGRGKKIRLFGFELNMTSGLLLFISSFIMILGGIIGLYIVINQYNETEYFPTAYFLVYLIIFMIGSYIFVQTIRYRSANS